MNPVLFCPDFDIHLEGAPVGTQQSFILHLYFSDAITTNFCTSISSVDQNSSTPGLSHYPNPSRGIFSVELASLLTGGQVTITNLLGEIIIEIPLTTLKTEVLLDHPDIYFAACKSKMERRWLSFYSVVEKFPHGTIRLIETEYLVQDYLFTPGTLFASDL